MTEAAYARVLDELLSALQAGDTDTAERILAAHPEWRESLEAERAFFMALQTTALRPDAALLSRLPTPLAQAALALLEAATPPARAAAVTFALETYALVPFALLLGSYAEGDPDPDVQEALAAFGREPDGERWWRALEALAACLAAEQRERELLREIRSRLGHPLPGLAGEPPLGPFLRSLCGSPLPTADPERLAALEGLVLRLFAADPLLHTIPWAYVRSYRRFGRSTYAHILVDLQGATPLQRRQPWILPDRALTAGRIYAFPRGRLLPLSLHPLFVWAEGRVLRFAFRGEGAGSYVASLATEGRIRRPPPLPGDPLEELLFPRSAAAPVGAAPAREFGDFRLVRRLGAGGMATVYLAEQKSLGRPVALKLLERGRFTPSLLERFRREARAVARLEHPGIVKVYQVGEEEGLPYIAMEYVDGPSLEQILAATPVGQSARLPLTRADRSPIHALCRVAREVALALEHAHRHGVIHRDVKPGNILLDREGHAHLTDFGLARERGQADLTLTGDVVGTPHYLAPEQIAARRIAVDHRADIYALGVTLYRMLTGRLPFTGESLEQVLRQIALKEPLPPRKVNPHVSRDLETVCLKAMEKDPDARYPTAAALAADLEAVMELRPIQARRIGPAGRLVRLARRRPVPAALAAALSVLLLIWATTTWARHRRDAALVERSLGYARALLAAGRPREALPHFQRVLEVEPEHPEARAAARRIQRELDLARAYELAFDWDDPADPSPAQACLPLLDSLRTAGGAKMELDLLAAQVLVRLGREDPALLARARKLLAPYVRKGASPGLLLLYAAALRPLDPEEAARCERRAARMAPRDDRDLLLLAAAHMAREDWQAALAELRRILVRGGPEALAAASHAARCAYWLGDHLRALEYLRFVEQARGRTPRLLRRRAVYLWHAGNPARALAALEEALRRDPDYVLARITRGALLDLQGRSEAALEELDRAQRLAPKEPLVYATRSQILVRLGRHEEALTDLDRALRLRPTFVRARLARARLCLRLGEEARRSARAGAAKDFFTRALADLEALPESGALGARVLATRALACWHLGRRAEARRLAEQALQAEPSPAEAHHVLALLALEEGQAEEALAQLDRALRRDPELWELRRRRAGLRFRRGDLTGALEDLNRVVAAGKADAAVRINRAWIFLKLGRLAEAAQEIEAALAAGPRPEAFLARHYLRLQEDRDWEGALGDLEEALRRGPDLPAVHLAFAEYFWRRAQAGEGSPGRDYARAAAFWARARALVGGRLPGADLEERCEQARRRAGRAALEDRDSPPPLVQAFRAWALGLRRDPAAPAAWAAAFRALPASPPPRASPARVFAAYAARLLLEAAPAAGQEKKVAPLRRWLKTLEASR